MPAKATRSTPRPSFVLPKVTVAVQTSLCLAGRREKRQYSRRFGSHLGNVGSQTIHLTQQLSGSALTKF
jgi:hypothetical protein